MLVLLLFSLLFLPSRLDAWGSATHRALTRKALEIYRSRSFEGDPAFGDFHRLLDGVEAPDRHGPGWIPSYYHSYDPTKERAPGGGPGMLTHLEYLVFQSRADKAFEMGRALHILQDLAQPFHTGRGLQEWRFHAPFEAWVDAHCEELIGHIQPEPVRRSGREVAEASRREYIRLHVLCRRKPWGKDLRCLSEKCLGRALDASIAHLKRTVERNRRIDGSRSAQEELAWLFLLCLVTHLLPRSVRPDRKCGRKRLQGDGWTSGAQVRELYQLELNRKSPMRRFRLEKRWFHRKCLARRNIAMDSNELRKKASPTIAPSSKNNLTALHPF